MDLNNYIDIFIEESKEHLQSINDHLLNLESDHENIGIVNEIFRSAHTLKGMAGSMGYEDLAALTHEMENVLDLLRNSKIQINTDIMDIIFECIDLIEKMVDSIEQGGDGKANVQEVVNHLKKIQNPSYTPSVGSRASLESAATAELVMDEFQLTVIEEAKKSGLHIYHIKVSLDQNCVMKAVRAYLVFQAAGDLGEIIQTIPPVEQIEEEKFDDSFIMTLLTDQEAREVQTHLSNVSEVREVVINDLSEKSQMVPEILGSHSSNEGADKVAQKEINEATQSKKVQRSKSIRVDIEKLDQLMNLFSEFIIDRGRLEQIARLSQNADLTDTVEHMNRISSDLQGVILKMRMVPVEQVFNRFPRMVRDLAKDLNKKVQLIVEGAETELDRTVIDEIGDPLIHLLRNALDHGLETVDERLAANKPEDGTIYLKAYHSGNHVFIEVSDDGRGINRDKVLNKAIERGVVTEAESQTLSDNQVYALLFSSGFSTADKISDISGRGVGLDVVKSKIESLGGVITIDSTLGKGSIFNIQLPLTLSIINAMLVSLDQETFAIPTNSIVEIAHVLAENIKQLHGQDVIEFRNQVIPLIYLKEVFQVPSISNETRELFIAIVRKGNKTVGLVVDEVIGQQEIVLKSLGSYLQNVFGISGGTILGDGKVALIVDSNQFFQ